MRKDKERLIRTIIISNENKIDVFRIHVFEKSIKFDPYFAYGVSKNDTIYGMVSNIENLWVQRRIELSDIFNMMVDIIEKHEKYLEAFYFKTEELGYGGRLVSVNPYSINDDKDFSYFLCAQNQNKLKKISRNEFEKNMKSEKIAYSYVENYSDKKATFFNYTTSGLRNGGKNCYFMVVDDNLKVGFIKN